jgi:hypothetical protein
MEEMSFMKKIKLVIVAAALMGMVSSSAAYADGYAPGEGLYLGAFAGTSTGIVQAKVANYDAIKGDGTFDTKNGGLAMFGVQGGGWLGYGYKMGDFYLGWDMDFAGSGEKFELTSGTGVELATSDDATTHITKITAERNWRGAGGARVGYYVNADTLLTFKGGVHASEFSIDDSRTSRQSIKSDLYAGGWQVGLGLESRVAAIDPNLSVRLEASYDGYLTAPVSGLGSGTDGHGGNTGHDSEVTGNGTNARIGLQYSFFDVNSLF